jgi:type I restriction enzyme S subunit
MNFDSKRKPVTKDARTSGEIPYYGASGIVDYVSDYIFDGDYLLISEDGANLLARSTPIAFSISGKAWVNNHAHVLKFEHYETRRLVEFYLNSIDLRQYISGGAQPKLNKANMNKIPIPIPGLPEQRRIVSVLDKFEELVNDISVGLPAELKARRQQYEYYRSKLLTFQEAVA